MFYWGQKLNRAFNSRAELSFEVQALFKPTAELSKVRRWWVLTFAKRSVASNFIPKMNLCSNEGIVSFHTWEDWLAERLTRVSRVTQLGSF